MTSIIKSTDNCRIGIGLMSGTSLDGIDVSLVSIKGSGVSTEVTLLDFMGIDYTAEEREAILRLCSPDTSDVKSICYANVWLGKKFGHAAKQIMDKNDLSSKDIDFVASHGQTIYHMPEVGATLQIGELADIAAITGCTTIGDFRPSDMAMGGEGAPLVPYMDYTLFSHPEKTRILVNIGGISNLTLLVKNGTRDEVMAFDCGPGNMLIDRCISRLTDGEKTYDDGGAIAFTGQIRKDVLDKILSEDKFVYASPPKSTGRELYNESKVDFLLGLKESYDVSFEDFIATITAYTYKALSINIGTLRDSIDVDEIFVGGGGTKNRAIMSGLEDMAGIPIHSMEDLGIPSDAKESIAFAIMGNEFINRKPNNIKSATGALSDVVMGKLVHPPSI